MGRTKYWDGTKWVEIAPSAQEFDEHQADDIQHVKYGVATGTANTYAVALDPAPIAYVEGMAVAFKVPVASTDAPTLNVNGLGAKGIKKANGTDATNLNAGGIYTVRYDGTAFILQGEGGSGNLQPNQALAGYTFTNDEGEQIGQGDPDLVPSNIRKNINVFGVVGTLEESPAFTASPGNITIMASNAPSGTTAYNFSKVKDIFVRFGGSIRVTFTLQMENTTGYARIYKNGAAIGVQRTASSSPQTYSEDITVSVGDNIQIYARSLVGTSQTIVSDFTVNVNQIPTYLGQIIK